MTRDFFDRLRWRLRLGEPGPVERAAAAIAARELSEADVDLPTWRRAAGGARDEARARDRYVRLRVARLRRQLRAEAGPLLAADRDDRGRQSAAFHRRAAAYRATPEGERAYLEALAVAERSGWALALLYYAALLLILLLGIGLGAC